MISIREIRALLKYDPESGALTWKRRPLSMFASARHGRTWNSRWAGKPAFTALRCGYPHGVIFGKSYQAHRIAWAIHHGAWPSGEIDHVNGKRTDYRISNLRDVAKIENAKNMRRRLDNTTGATGVYRHGQNNRWVARIGRKYISSHATFEGALAARRSAERAHGYHPNAGRVS